MATRGKYAKWLEIINVIMHKLHTIKKWCINKRKAKMDIKELEIDKVTPYSQNARLNDEAVEYVANSIKKFGFQQPIVLDKNNVIIAGHTRWRAAKKLGMEKVPVVIAASLNDEAVKAYRLADNKTAEIADWDYDKLFAELDAIEDYDMTDFGFSVEQEDLDDVDLNGETDEQFADTFALNVVLKNEKEQETLYKKLSEEGYEVKVVNI